ncbi:MAG: DUF433 domain-containing protein [Bacteroidota bacterium]
MKDWRKYIESNPNKMYGKPVISGTRVAVDLILEKMSNGETVEELLNSYPHITKEAVFACLRFASESIKTEKIYPLAS